MLARHRLLFSSLVVFAALLFVVLPALAHEEVTVGPYALEVGWVDEPSLVGVKNAVFLSVKEKDNGKPVEDISQLTVTISTGGRDKELIMRPLGEETPGQFAGDFIPTRRGVYTVKLSGKIEQTDANVSQDIEEVEDAASLQFPEPLPDALATSRSVDEAKAAAANAQTLAVIGIAVGVIALLVGVLSLRRHK